MLKLWRPETRLHVSLSTAPFRRLSTLPFSLPIAFPPSSIHNVICLVHCFVLILAVMATPPPAASVRQRGPKKPADPLPVEQLPSVAAHTAVKVAPPKQSEWDFKLALLVITVAAFATRFWGISHPNQVVFDEVHFGKVRSSLLVI
jgi:Dolichyl-phosphate-mannose-protein mannosyltransferase